MKASGCLGIVLGLLGACRGPPLSNVQALPTVGCANDPAACSTSLAGRLETVDFGPVFVGAARELDLDFASPLSAAVDSFTALGDAGPFSLALGAGSALDSAGRIVPAVFAPTAVGPASASWSLVSSLDSTAPVTVALRGSGALFDLQVQPDPVEFDKVVVGESQSVQLTLTNRTAVPMTLSEVSVAFDGGPAPFSVPASSAPLLVPAGGTAGLTVSYQPETLSAGDRGWLQLGVCAPPCGASLSLPLHGTPVPGALATNAPLDFGVVAAKGNATKPLVFQNLGNLPLTISDIQLTGTAFRLDPAAPSPPQTLAPHQSLDVPVDFDPLAVTYYSASGSASYQIQGQAVSSQVALAAQGIGGGALLSCTPSPLPLGPTLVGQAQRAQVFCQNVGFDLPGAPGLAFGTGDFSLTGANFRGTLDPASASPLVAGQQAIIDVDYLPTAVETDTGVLAIGAAPAPDGGAIAIPLSGQGIQPAPCSFSLSAPLLDFSAVPVGTTELLDFTIANDGSDFCAVEELALAAGSDPAFALYAPDGGTAYQLLSYAGNSNNPLKLPTRFDVAVAFRPTQTSLAPVSGAVDFKLAPGSAPAQSVALRGQGVSSCITIDPSVIDVGQVGFDAVSALACQAVDATVVLKNSCAVDLNFTAATINPLNDGSPEWAVVLGPGIAAGQDIALPAGGQASVVVEFNPLRLGPSLEQLVLQLTAGSGPALTARVSLTGVAQGSGHRSEASTLTGGPIDVLWVIDNDDDRGGPEVEAAAVVGTLTQLLSDEGVDYHMAVMSPDLCAGSGDGRFEPCADCVVRDSDTATIVTPASANPSGALRQLFDGVVGGDENGTRCSGYGTGVGPLAFDDDRVGDAALAAFDPALVGTGGHNANFRRAGAHLVIVSANYDQGADANDHHDPQYYLSQLQALAGATGNLTWISLVQTFHSDTKTFPEPAPNEVDNQIARFSGGLALEVTHPDFSQQFLQLMLSTTGLGAVTLKAPAKPGSIQVFVNGLPLAPSNWTYAAPLQQVQFVAGQAGGPMPGDKILVTYDVGCG